MELHDAFARLARAFPEPTLLVSAAGVIRAANDACATLFHTPVAGRALSELTATAAADLNEYLSLCARNRQFVMGAVNVRGADGLPIAYRCEGALVSDPSESGEAHILMRLRPRADSAQRFIALTQEVDQLRTEIRRRQAVEGALRTAEAFALSILNNVVDCINVLDLEGRLLTMNEPGRRALRIEDVTPYVNKPWLDFWQGEDRASALRALEEAAGGGVGDFVGCSPIAGEVRWWEVVVTPIPGADGRPAQLLAVSRDVTERRRIENERADLLHREQAARAHAEHASQLKDEFLATVSHELRTPLTAILGWARLLRDGRVDPSRTRSALETIERNAQMQALLIEDLLDVSRIAAGQLRLKHSDVPLPDVIEKATEAVRPSAQSKAIALDVNVAAGSRVVAWGDPDRLQQVVWNLLTNAVKFTPAGGRVAVRLYGDAATARIEVSDTGQGFTPEVELHIFEPFRQADGSTTRVQGGLGLGLTITKQLVEAHGGTIQARSAGPGRGAAFIVTLPVQPRRGAAVQHKEPIDAVDLSGVCALVVDDEADARELMTVMLERYGARVLTAPSAADALAILTGERRDRPNVVLADIGMPGQDGYEFIRTVRATESGAERVPAIAVTAFARGSDRALALRAGFDAHVPKPAEPQALARTIAGLMRQRDAV